jgi:lipopolysaccharide/colanic/teichoic acid biosynthesis glycosyltransferase
VFVYRRKLYTTIQVCLDLASFWPIWECAIRLRTFLNPFMKLQLTWPHAGGWVPAAGPVLALWIAVAIRTRVYRAPHEIRPWTILLSAGQNTVFICALTVLTTFFSRQFGAGISRSFVVCMLPVTLLILILSRCLSAALIASIQRRSRQPRIALIGDSTNAMRLISTMEGGIRSAIRGLILPEGAIPGISGGLVPVLGTTRQMAELINRERIDHAILLNGSVPDSELERCKNVFLRMGLPMSCTLDFAAESTRERLGWLSRGRFELSEEYGLRVVEVRRHADLNGAQDVVKLVFDFTFASIALLVAAPAMLLVALFIKLATRGPVWEKSPRVGKGGRHFTCFRFHTGCTCGNAVRVRHSGHATEERRFPGTACTNRIGHFLRRYALDELPQLLNILRREMSVVGPRPLPAHDLGPDGMSLDFFDWSQTRALVLPGLTGLWQIGGRSELSFDDMVRLDLEYIQKRSFWLDIRIILKTPLSMLQRDGTSEGVRGA